MEWQEKHPSFSSDDNSLPPNSALKAWDKHFFEAGRKFGTDPSSPKNLKRLMEETGFIDVEEHILKLPVGTWPKKPRLKNVGVFERANMVEGISGLSLMLFTRELGWTREEVEVFLVDVRKESCDRNIHAWYNL